MACKLSTPTLKLALAGVVVFAAMGAAVVAGAVAGVGLTVIANAPNPAGQSILAKFFPGGISPPGPFLGALPATVILLPCFLLLR